MPSEHVEHVHHLLGPLLRRDFSFVSDLEGTTVSNMLEHLRCFYPGELAPAGPMEPSTAASLGLLGKQHAHHTSRPPTCTYASLPQAPLPWG